MEKTVKKKITYTIHMKSVQMRENMINLFNIAHIKWLRKAVKKRRLSKMPVVSFDDNHVYVDAEGTQKEMDWLCKPKRHEAAFVKGIKKKIEITISDVK